MPHGSDFVHCSLRSSGRLPGRLELAERIRAALHAGIPAIGGGHRQGGQAIWNRDIPTSYSRRLSSLDTVNRQLTAKNANVVAAKDKNGMVSQYSCLRSRGEQD